VIVRNARVLVSSRILAGVLVAAWIHARCFAIRIPGDVDVFDWIFGTYAAPVGDRTFGTYSVPVNDKGFGTYGSPI
jgi:hypothetical protein